MAKYHFLTGDDLLAMPMTDRVARCVEIKAEVVASDEREGGRRAMLNYGHTLAHALEIATEHDWPTARRSPSASCSPPTSPIGSSASTARASAQHIEVVGEAYGLRRRCRPVSTRRLLALMGRDKKALDGLTFVLDGPQGVEVVAGRRTGGRRSTLELLAR